MYKLASVVRVREGLPYAVTVDISSDAIIHALIDRALRSKKGVASALGRGVRVTVREIGSD